MDFSKALNLKKEIADTVLSKKKKARTFSLATASKAIAVTAEGDLQTTINGVGVGEKQSGENFIKILTRDNPTVSPAALAQFYGVKREEIIIEKVGPIQFKNPQVQHRPPFPGISCGHYRITAGTLGCFVKNQRGQVYILSNNHVLGDTDRGHWQDPILQPGRLDGGTRRKHVIAFLSHLVPLSRSRPNTMDAAIANVVEDLNPDFRIYQQANVQGTLDPRLRMKVEKWGRTTGHTTGSITTRNLDIQVEFGKEILDFQDQFEIKAARGMFCDGGDSGSLILEKDTFNAVGLLFAGNEEGTTFASPIREVLTAFSVQII